MLRSSPIVRFMHSRVPIFGSSRDQRRSPIHGYYIESAGTGTRHRVVAEQQGATRTRRTGETVQGSSVVLTAPTGRRLVPSRVVRRATLCIYCPGGHVDVDANRSEPRSVRPSTFAVRTRHNPSRSPSPSRHQPRSPLAVYQSPSSDAILPPCTSHPPPPPPPPPNSILVSVHICDYRRDHGDRGLAPSGQFVVRGTR